MTKIQRALLSVFDKTGLIPFAQALAAVGVEIISTGGTAKALREHGIMVSDLSAYTEFPEMMDGRVKTLHPRIHGGLLYLRGNPTHEAAARKHDIKPIDLVVVNLYPFEQTIARPGVTLAEAIENIDIGGPSMLRSASKNHESVTVVMDPADYAEVAAQITANGNTTPELRRRLAARAFARTAAYDRQIAGYLAKVFGLGAADGIDESVLEEPARGTDVTGGSPAAGEALPARLRLDLPKAQKLRYGENPHQRAALYGRFGDFFQQLHGRELSYNNILDLTSGAALAEEFAGEGPALVIVKHTNPCGAGRGATLREAWEKAFATDQQAPYGGIIAVNQTLDLPCAEAIMEIFSEVIVAPDFAPAALELLGKKKNLRLLKALKCPGAGGGWELRGVGGGSVLAQEWDREGAKAGDLKIVTRRQPTEAELEAMMFGWRVAKHVKSNAIVYVGPDRTLGIGAGQMSRVDASRLAVWKAGEAGLSLKGSVVCSDAFFPFVDGLAAAAEAGATAAIQPGGSMHDAEVIAAADARKMAMAFTGVRHFRH
jgi:phosphoribosylaminoimidazolecarboxamide formyltransferase/IMP cyclohydrolase